MPEKHNWKESLRYLESKLATTDAPCLVVDDKGTVRSFSRFFRFESGEGNLPALSDFLPNIQPSDFQKIWQKTQQESLLYWDAEVKHRSGLVFPVNLRWLSLRGGLAFASADLPGSNSYLDTLVQSTAAFNNTLFWEINLLSNSCTIEGGRILELFGLQPGFYWFRRAELRRIVQRKFSKATSQALQDKLKTTWQTGKRFEETIAWEASGNSYEGLLSGHTGVDGQPSNILLGQLEALSKAQWPGRKPIRLDNTKPLDLSQPIESLSPFPYLQTASGRYLELLRRAEMVARTESTVLISGETGTGKELLAKVIHESSPRARHPLVKVNCAAIPHHLFESSMFGHEKGAFTGAHQQHIGKFEQADGGTLFLDEIGEMPLNVQHKLLRVLQEGEFERVGGTQTLRCNVRIVAATNRDLRKMTENGAFRKDLYYRLSVFPMVNLPLRERPEDIPLLVQHFIRKHTVDRKSSPKTVTPESMDLLYNYHFPGNIRELENLIERALIISKGASLDITNSFDPLGGEAIKFY